ncbi:hypothetical protein [Undibacterium sp.]|uniref:hypothetical protein n=1 Tax=Undibacterium sp. TaxID=1914977 RepID=UPI0037518F51
MINKEKSKILHFLAALPVAALVASFVFVLIAAVENIFMSESTVWDATANLMMSPILILISSFYMLIFIVPIGIPAYLILRRLNQLKFSTIVSVGLLAGFSMPLVLHTNNPLWLPDWFFLMNGFTTSATVYVVLKKFAGRTPSLPLHTHASRVDELNR